MKLLRKRNGTETALALATFCLTLAVYIKTLAPTVTFTDSGELAVDCITLGIAHPTGYPLFTILGHLWTLLPLPFTPIYKLNLFAAVCTSLSVVVFFQVVLMVLRRVSMLPITPLNPPLERGEVKDRSISVIAFATALAYGFSRTVWDQANAVEVYALHLLLALTATRLFLKALWAEKQKTTGYLVFAFALGLSFTNHLTTLWLIPAMFFLFVKRFGFGKQMWMLLLKMTGPFALALLVYLYMPLRSAGHFPFHSPPKFDWGGVGRGWDKFLYHVTAQYYKPFMFTGTWPKQLQGFFTTFPYQVAFIGLAPIALGIYRLFRRDKPLLIFLGILIVTCVGAAVNYGISDISSYFMVANIAALLLMAVGLRALAESSPKLAATALLIPVLAVGLNYGANDLSQDHLVEEYTTNFLDNLGPNAILFTDEWSYFDSPCWYLQEIEGHRRDVTLIQTGFLSQTWYLEKLPKLHPEIMPRSGEALRAYEADIALQESGRPYDQQQLTAHYTDFMNALIDTNYPTRPIYFTTELYNAHPGVAVKYKGLPAGIAFRWVEDPKSIQPWDIRLNFDRFLSYPVDMSNYRQAGIYKAAVRAVERSAQFEALYGRKASADELNELADRLKAKIQ